MKINKKNYLKTVETSIKDFFKDKIGENNMPGKYDLYCMAIIFVLTLYHIFDLIFRNIYLEKSVGTLHFKLQLFSVISLIFDFNLALFLLIRFVLFKTNNKKINTKLSETNEKLEQAYLSTIQTLRYTVEAKDTYTRGHSDRVSQYSVLIGKHLGLSDNDLHDLEVGGLFHDIGKIGIPDAILRKEAKLTDDEYSEIKNHPAIGAHILSSAVIFQNIIPIVKHHHEKYDGTGYPGRLKGEEIPYLARIAAIADTFDAMTSKRSYRDSLPMDVVIAEFERCKGTQFDPELDDVFLDILKNHYDEIEKIRETYK